MACGTEIQVLITSGLFRLLCLHIFTYKHALVYYLLIAEICIYLDERWTSISFSLMFVIYCREILKPIQRRCSHINMLVLANEIIALKGRRCPRRVFQFKDAPYPTGIPYAKFQKRTVVQSVSLLIAKNDEKKDFYMSYYLASSTHKRILLIYFSLKFFSNHRVFNFCFVRNFLNRNLVLLRENHLWCSWAFFLINEQYYVLNSLVREGVLRPTSENSRYG
uniref:Secreted protein n=1 Tax=Heterorhabditis bacteriophora TaxID=37862 RepID=A0A1I7WV34_HETBA